ncbi:MAG: hypothetical protein ACLP1X_35720 [Polyangiaceae bacterium]
MRRYSSAIFLCGLTACRFGGPSADPSQYVSADDGSSSPEASDEASSGDEASVESDMPDASSEAAQGALLDATADEGAGKNPFPEESTAVSNCQPSVPVCDPVHNTGCNPLQQCDVDPTQTQTPTGLCVFGSPSDAAMCLATAVTESCGPGSTCAGGTCRSLCYCDSDCPPGQCCSGTSNAGAFLLCESCE